VKGISVEYDRKIIGVLSNSQNKYKYSHFTQLMKSYIEEDIGIIYICEYIKESSYIENYFQSILEDKYEEVMEKEQIKILNRDYIEEKDNISKTFTNLILSEINDMEENLYKNIRIYINVDKHINIIPKDDLYTMFELITRVSKEHNIKVILRFFMDEIMNFEFFSLMSETGYFVVEDITKDDFLLTHYSKILTSSNLFLDSRIPEKMGLDNKQIEYNNDQSLNRIVDEVSHDLKNIFATISGYTQLAMAKVESIEIKEYLKTILNSSLDIHSILEKFNNHSFNLEIDKSVYSLNRIVISASQMAFNMSTNKLNLDSQKVHISYSLNSQKDIYCNKCQIKQVIMNIVDNGIQALEGKGNIIINTYDSTDGIVLEILDSGSGIDEKTKEKIFQPYFTTKGILGMGLGLDIAKRTLENHGATISVDSRVGVGTKFTIVFPRTDKELTVDSEEKSIYNIS
jgi:signal transduction histidine kinase